MTIPDSKGPHVEWPALLRHPDEPELTVVLDETEWTLDPDLHAWPHHADARLIDSEGWEYALLLSGPPGRGCTSLTPTGHRATVQGVIALAEAHLRTIGAPPEWLASHLADLPSAVQIRAAVLYISRPESKTAPVSREGTP